MKYAIALFAFLLTAAVGCSQVSPNPTAYSCQVATGAAYTPLDQASPAATVNYTDSKPGAGEYCYIAQSVITSTGQISVPSNVAGPYAVSSTESVVLTGIAPTSGPTPSGYVFSRAPAVASTLGAPALNLASVSQVRPEKLAAPPDKTLAMAAPTGLRLGDVR